MRKISYQDEQGRTINKKEGFSWPTFWFLMIFTVGIGAILYAYYKGGFIMLRGTWRKGRKIFKKKKVQDEK